MMSESKGSCRKPSGFMEDELGCKCAKTVSVFVIAS